MSFLNIILSRQYEPGGSLIDLRKLMPLSPLLQERREAAGSSIGTSLGESITIGGKTYTRKGKGYRWRGQDGKTYDLSTGRARLTINVGNNTYFRDRDGLTWQDNNGNHYDIRNGLASLRFLGLDGRWTATSLATRGSRGSRGVNSTTGIASGNYFSRGQANNLDLMDFKNLDDVKAFLEWAHSNGYYNNMNIRGNNYSDGIFGNTTASLYKTYGNKYRQYKLSLADRENWKTLQLNNIKAALDLFNTKYSDEAKAKITFGNEQTNGILDVSGMNIINRNALYTGNRSGLKYRNLLRDAIKNGQSFGYQDDNGNIIKIDRNTANWEDYLSKKAGKRFDTDATLNPNRTFNAANTQALAIYQALRNSIAGTNLNGKSFNNGIMYLTELGWNDAKTKALNNINTMLSNLNNMTGAPEIKNGMGTQFTGYKSAQAETNANNVKKNIKFTPTDISDYALPENEISNNQKNTMNLNELEKSIFNKLGGSIAFHLNGGKVINKYLPGGTFLSRLFGRGVKSIGKEIEGLKGILTESLKALKDAKLAEKTARQATVKAQKNLTTHNKAIRDLEKKLRKIKDTSSSEYKKLLKLIDTKKNNLTALKQAKSDAAASHSAAKKTIRTANLNISKANSDVASAELRLAAEQAATKRTRIGTGLAAAGGLTYGGYQLFSPSQQATALKLQNQYYGIDGQAYSTLKEALQAALAQYQQALQEQLDSLRQQYEAALQNLAAQAVTLTQSVPDTTTLDTLTTTTLTEYPVTPLNTLDVQQAALATTVLTPQVALPTGPVIFDYTHFYDGTRQGMLNRKRAEEAVNPIYFKDPLTNLIVQYDPNIHTKDYFKYISKLMKSGYGYHTPMVETAVNNGENLVRLSVAEDGYTPVVISLKRGGNLFFRLNNNKILGK